MSSKQSRSSHSKYGRSSHSRKKNSKQSSLPDSKPPQKRVTFTEVPSQEDGQEDRRESITQAIKEIETPNDQVLLAHSLTQTGEGGSLPVKTSQSPKIKPALQKAGTASLNEGTIERRSVTLEPPSQSKNNGSQVVSQQHSIGSDQYECYPASLVDSQAQADYRFYENLYSVNDEGVLSFADQLFLQTSSYIFSFYGDSKVLPPNLSINQLSYNQQYMGILGVLRNPKVQKWWTPGGMMPFQMGMGPAAQKLAKQASPFQIMGKLMKSQRIAIEIDQSLNFDNNLGTFDRKRYSIPMARKTFCGFPIPNPALSAQFLTTIERNISSQQVQRPCKSISVPECIKLSEYREQDWYLNYMDIRDIPETIIEEGGNEQMLLQMMKGSRRNRMQKRLYKIIHQERDKLQKEIEEKRFEQEKQEEHRRIELEKIRQEEREKEHQRVLKELETSQDKQKQDTLAKLQEEERLKEQQDQLLKNQIELEKQALLSQQEEQLKQQQDQFLAQKREMEEEMEKLRKANARDKEEAAPKQSILKNSAQAPKEVMSPKNEKEEDQGRIRVTKKVSISQEIKILTGQHKPSNKNLSEDHSYSSIEDKSSKKGVIMEEESALEDNQTPASRIPDDKQIKNIFNQVNATQVASVKVEPAKKNLMSPKQQKREPYELASSIKVEPGQQFKRQRTQDKRTQDKMAYLNNLVSKTQIKKSPSIRGRATNQGDDDSYAPSHTQKFAKKGHSARKANIHRSSCKKKVANERHADSVNLTQNKNQPFDDKNYGLRDSIGGYIRDQSSNNQMDRSQKTSLNLTVDNQLEQLSMNFGNFKKLGGELRDSSVDRDDFSNSPPRDYVKKSKKGGSLYDAIKARSKQKIDQQSNLRFGQDSNRGASQRSGQEMQEGDTKGQNPFRRQFSNTSDRNEESELKLDKDRISRRMVQIYLKTPYKVMSIQEAKQKPDSTSAKLFHAENQLKVHSQFRHEQRRRKAKQHLFDQIVNKKKKQVRGSSQSPGRMQQYISSMAVSENQSISFKKSDKLDTGPSFSKGDKKTDTKKKKNLSKGFEIQKEKTMILSSNTTGKPFQDQFDDRNMLMNDIKPQDQTSQSEISEANKFISNSVFVSTGPDGSIGKNNISTNILARPVVSQFEQIQESDIIDDPNDSIQQAPFQPPKSMASSIVENLGNQSEERQNEAQFIPDFKLKFYDQLLGELTRRLEFATWRVSQIRKQKDILNIYGQTLPLITFGDISYSSKGQDQSTPERQIQRKKMNQAAQQRYSMLKTYGFQQDLNTDLLEPLSQKLKDSKEKVHKETYEQFPQGDTPNLDDSNSAPSMKNTYSQERVYINKLNLSNLQDEQKQQKDSSDTMQEFNPKLILAESARVQKHIISNSIKGKSEFPTLSSRSPKSFQVNYINRQSEERPFDVKLFSDDEKTSVEKVKDIQNIKEISENDDEDTLLQPSDIEAQNQMIQSFCQPDGSAILDNQERANLLTLQKQNKLLMLLKMGEKMGLSFQKLKLLKHRYQELERTELHLDRILKLKKIIPSPPVQHTVAGQKFPISQQKMRTKKLPISPKMEPKFCELNEIKSFYPEPIEPAPVRNKIQQRKSAANQPSIVQVNKQVYANKLKELTQTSSKPTALASLNMTAQSRKQSVVNSNSVSRQLEGTSGQLIQGSFNFGSKNTSIFEHEDTVKDYYGHKINIRRSIEQKMNHNPKPFKRKQIEEPRRQQTTEASKGRDLKPEILAESFPMNQLKNSSQMDRQKVVNFIKENKKNLLPFSPLDDDIIQRSSELTCKKKVQPKAKFQLDSPQKHLTGKFEDKPSRYQIHDYIPQPESINEKSNSELIEVRKEQERIADKIKKSNSYKKGPIFQKEGDQSPIRQQRSKFIDEIRKSKKMLIQSGQHIVGKTADFGDAKYSFQQKQSGSKLAHLYKNSQYYQAPPIQKVTQTMKGQQHVALQGIPSSNYGVPSNFQRTKQSMILQGVLNQQRRYNRVIGNGSVPISVKNTQDQKPLLFNRGEGKNDGEIGEQQIRHLANNSMSLNTSILSGDPMNQSIPGPHSKNFDNHDQLTKTLQNFNEAEFSVEGNNTQENSNLHGEVRQNFYQQPPHQRGSQSHNRRPSNNGTLNGGHIQVGRNSLGNVEAGSVQVATDPSRRRGEYQEESEEERMNTMKSSSLNAPGQ